MNKRKLTPAAKNFDDQLTSDDDVGECRQEALDGELKSPCVGVASGDWACGTSFEEIASALVSLRDRHVNWDSECGSLNLDVQSVERAVWDDVSTSREDLVAGQCANVWCAMD